MKVDPTVQKMMNKIGKRVMYKYPGKEPARSGTLLDRVVLRTNPGSAIAYWDVVDLIRFPNRPNWIRVGYYRRANGRLVWAGQTTISDSFAVWKRLLIEAAKKDWFRGLLEDVMAELPPRPSDS